MYHNPRHTNKYFQYFYQLLGYRFYNFEVGVQEASWSSLKIYSYETQETKLKGGV